MTKGASRAALLAVLSLLVATRALPCTTDADCFTFDACLKNVQCIQVPIVGGVCYSEPVHCDDRGPCVFSHCDHNVGCVYQPACPDDGVTCNGDEYCIPSINGPQCTRTTVDCNDGDACTIDACNEPGGCVHTPVNCGDGDACTADSCSPSTGCKHEPIFGCCRSNLDCPDEPCVVGRLCGASFCSPGTPRDCDDGDPATLDTCDPSAGCQHTSSTPTTTIPSGTGCSADAECPADPDPCMRSVCVAGSCGSDSLRGLDGVACVCSRPLPGACKEPLPKAITRRSARACTVVGRAVQASGKKQLRLVGRVGRLLAAARKAALKKKNLPAGCGDGLAELFGDGASRAEAFQKER